MPRFVHALVRAAVLGRRPAVAKTLDALDALAKTRRKNLSDIESKRSERNAASEQMGKIVDKKSADFQAQRDSLRVLGDSIKALETANAKVELELENSQSARFVTYACDHQ